MHNIQEISDIEPMTVTLKPIVTDHKDFLGSYLIAGALVMVICLFVMLAVPNAAHWFILPAAVCGILMGADVVRWLRGFLDAFDPKGLQALLSFHGWFIAPLLHAVTGIYGRDLVFTGDPRYWLGVAAAANAVGMICYKVSQRWSFKRTREVRSDWRLVPQVILLTLLPAAIVGISAEAYYYIKLGEIARMADPHLAGRGMGWLLMLGDGLPVLFLVAFISWTMVPKRNRSWVLIAVFLGSCASIQFVWSGLRGSRSAFVVMIIVAVGLIHFYWRRLKAWHLVLGLALLMPFLYVYGFYKAAGPQALKALDSPEARMRLEQKTGRNKYSVLLGDLARADVQACIANGVVTGRYDYQLRYGRTYLNSLSKLVPYSIWEGLLGDISFKEAWFKGFAFYELNEGKVKSPNIQPSSSRVYGLGGEAMLNFGLVGVPLAWLFYGVVMGWFRRKMQTLPGGDTRWALMPMGCIFLMTVPFSDSDNLIYGLLKGGAVLFLCVYLWSSKNKLILKKSTQ